MGQTSHAASEQQRHYFDHAATSPMRECAKTAFMQSLDYLNPGGQYDSGRRARAALEEARETIASLLGCDPIEVIFTASGTEADNLAIWGHYRGAQKRQSSSNRILVGVGEHPAAFEPVTQLSKFYGAETAYIPINPDGHYPDYAQWLAEGPIQDGDGAVRDGKSDLGSDNPWALNADRDAVVVYQWANNETGAIHPFESWTEAAAEAGVGIHLDAVQVVGHHPIDFRALNGATVAASAHKFGGPRGCGMLLVGRGTPIHPLLAGGGQERGLRPGTANVAGAVATAAALKEACENAEEENRRISELRDELAGWLRRHVPDAHIFTQQPALPGHLHLAIPGASGDSMIMLFDQAGFELSTGSACAAGVNRISRTVSEMGVDAHLAQGTLRFTLGRTTTDADIAALQRCAVDVFARAQAAGLS